MIRKYIILYKALFYDKGLLFFYRKIFHQGLSTPDPVSVDKSI
jgi:hypothetical protein